MKIFLNQLPNPEEVGPDDLIVMFGQTCVPFFEFDSDKYRLVLNVDKLFIDGSSLNGKYKGSLYFNTCFYELVSGMPSDRISRTGDLNYELTPDMSSIRSYKATNGSSYSLYQTSQEISSVAMESYSEHTVLHWPAPYSPHEYQPSPDIRRHIQQQPNK